MRIIKTIVECRQAISAFRSEGKSVGLVPTMGALHEGHLSLMRCAGRENDVVVASIFVNPTQFGPGEDLHAYPRRLEKDVALAEEAGVSIIFAPDASEMYGDGASAGVTWVTQERLTENLCGKSRPTHFRGVLTVVLKLFNIVMPDRAYFGQKDAQQALVIMRMVEDLKVPVTVRVCPTIRESDGLAMSSRNDYLSPQERADALYLSKALLCARELYESGERSCARIIEDATSAIRATPSAKIDYFSIVDPATLSDTDTIGRSALVAAAVFIGKTRLIDNIWLGEEPFPGAVCKQDVTLPADLHEKPPV